MGAVDPSSKLTQSILACCALVITALVVRRELFPPAPEPPTRRVLELTEVPNWQPESGFGQRIDRSTRPQSALVMFTDYECPACRWFAESALQGALANFGDSLMVRVRHLPLSYHRRAYLLARIAECAAGKADFRELNDVMYSLQDSTGVPSTQALLAAAGGGDSSDIESCAASKDPMPAIERDIAAATRIGATGTPTILLDGFLLSRVPDSLELDSLIRARFSVPRE